MARPNEGKSKIVKVHMQVSPKLKQLLLARKDALSNDGQIFARNASMNDISDEFVDHYWRLIKNTAAENQMRRSYNKMNGNIKA